MKIDPFGVQALSQALAFLVATLGQLEFVQHRQLALQMFVRQAEVLGHLENRQGTAQAVSATATLGNQAQA